MSYQFEDDSALEELLNQQLDRRRQLTLGGRPATSSNSKAPQPFRPSTSTLNNEVQSRPDKNVPPASDQSAVPKGKLANWLANTNDDASASASQISTKQAATLEDDIRKTDQFLNLSDRRASISSSMRQESAAKSKTVHDPKAALKSMLDESKLQEMSKQRLIQFVLEEIQPSIKESIECGDLKLRQEIDKLTKELEEEKERHLSREKRQIELIESKWQQLNKQLEARLEFSESELREARDCQKSLVKELDDEFKRQMRQMNERYQSRLEEEKRNSDEALKRSQQMHRLELESKLKVNMELDKLESTFGEWQRMVRLTVGELGDQLKTIESLLEKQTLEINTTNVDLCKKSQQLSEQYAKFESQTGRLDDLSTRLNEQILPQFSLAQKESQSALDKMNSKLQHLDKQTELVERAKLELEQQRQQLDGVKDELGKSKFQVALELSRLGFKEENLNDLIGKNERIGAELEEQRATQRQRELKFEALESSLDSKSKKLREQNYELHLIRKRLASKEEDLAKLESKLGDEAARFETEKSKVKEDKRRLDELRNRIKRESSQLCRLQKSLICSLCFGRLFDNDHCGKQPILDNLNESHLRSRSHFGRPGLFTTPDNQPHPEARPKDTPATAKDLADLELEALSDLNYLEADAKQLESECKYVDMLPMS